MQKIQIFRYLNIWQFSLGNEAAVSLYVYHLNMPVTTKRTPNRVQLFPVEESEHFTASFDSSLPANEEAPALYSWLVFNLCKSVPPPT